MRLGKGRTQRGLLLLAQQRMARSPVTALVAHTVGSSPIVAARDLADPIGGIARHTRDGRGGQSACQEPEEVPAAALNGTMGPAIPLMQLVVGQIRMEADAFWLAPVLQQLPAPPYERLRPLRFPLSP